jgi:hypothetical protein
MPIRRCIEKTGIFAGRAPGLFCSVRFGMLYRRVLRMIHGVQTMSVRYLRVVGRLLVVACQVILCRLSVVMRSLRVVISCVVVMIRCFR